ncbi:MAG TPA: cytochrome c1 [Wenzhouxiangella sp.]|nr:cytochrome c1 [Wenzhouxiangella sp.]
MKKFAVIFTAAVWLVSGAAVGDAGQLDSAGANVFDTASVQRGASYYVNYCLGCHSLQYMRYKRLSEDLDLTEEQVESLLMWGDQEIADAMTSNMDADESEEWFGITPPDLSLTARSRGVNWIYTYLRSFYLTDEGWNNTVLENASMPHVLWELQGTQRAITDSWTDEEGAEHVRVADLELDEPGLMEPVEYDSMVRDLAAFMHYASEPSILKRKSLGIWVLLVLAVFTFLSWLLYKDYWQDVKQ